jgi:hypothetical protein
LFGKLKRVMQKQKKTLFDKLAETVRNSVARANMFALLRKVYLNKKLKEIESANNYLILNHLVKLATVTKTKVDSRCMLKYLRVWKFNHESGKIRDEKLTQLKSTIDKFADEIKYNLFVGPDNISNKFNDFNNSVGIYNNPRTGTMKSLSDKASVDFKTQKSFMNKLNIDRASTLVKSSNNPKLNKKTSVMLDIIPQEDENQNKDLQQKDDNNRDTIAFGREAKAKFNKSLDDGK